MRCKHQNFSILETGQEHIQHVFKGGEYKFSDHSAGLEFVTVEVWCKDCGMVQRYSKSHFPKWLKDVCRAAGLEIWHGKGKEDEPEASRTEH